MEFLWEGLLSVTWQQLVMYAVGAVLIWLAIKKDYEPALLLPMGFGAILVNLPLSGVLNQTMQGVGETHGIIQWLFEIGIEASEAFPLLLFIGIGAMIDFGPLLSNPKMFLFGAAAQFGIFHNFLGRCFGLSHPGCGVNRHYRRRGRPHLHSGISSAEIQLCGADCSSRLLLYGAGAHHPAGCHQGCHYQERAGDPYGVPSCCSEQNLSLIHI